MKIEIERKFLVHSALLTKELLGRGQRLTQGYLAYGPTVRVRSANGEGAWLTIKGAGTLSREEYEYAIPEEDAAGLLALCKSSLAKTRYRVVHEGHTWEVDQFHGPHDGLWLAEIEMDHEDTAFESPPWLGEEVSHDPQYTNGALARAGRSP